MSLKKTVAVFDFDETLVTKDTLIDFARYSCSIFSFFLKSLQLLPIILLLKVKLIDNSRAKEAWLRRFFGGMPEDQFITLCDSYSRRLDSIVNQRALQRVAWHQARGDVVIIVSASAEDWIRPWASRHHMPQVIATQLHRKDGCITGGLQGLNCYGPEKVTRLLQEYPRRKDYRLYAYGDGKSDAALFHEADRVFRKRFS